MKNYVYLNRIEAILRKILKTSDEKFTDELQLNVISTIYNYLFESKKIDNEELENFMQNYKEYKNDSYTELEKKEFYFEHLIEDLKKFC